MQDLHDDAQASMNKEEKNHMLSSDAAYKEETHAATSQHHEFRPCIRSAVFAGQGDRRTMEDRHVVIDDVGQLVESVPTSFYAVFDGHIGAHAAEFAKDHLFPNFKDMMAILGHKQAGVICALTCAFLGTDTQFKNEELASGTTALAAVITGSKLYVANAGDCRAVICRNGNALDMSVDHDPRKNTDEYNRITQAGGFLEEGYLNGIINMSRALGDWDHKGLKGPGPLVAYPEIKTETLTEEDEFMIVASDGLFKGCSSQSAVDFVRRELKKHNDLEKCARDLAEAEWENVRCGGYLTDNSTVVIVSFSKEAQPSVDTVGSKGKKRSKAQRTRREAKKKRKRARRPEAPSL